jgi:hypothetical protein
METNSQRHVSAHSGQCSAAISRLLVGAWVPRVEYLCTAWEIEFNLPENGAAVSSGFLKELDGVVLQAEADDLSELQSDAELARTLVLSTSCTVQSVEVDNSSNLAITFSSGAKAQFLGVAGPVDEVWSIYTRLDSGRRRQFGEPALVQSYFGDLSIDPAFAAFGGSTFS